MTEAGWFFMLGSFFLLAVTAAILLYDRYQRTHHR